MVAPLTQEEIDAAAGGFSAPPSNMSSSVGPFAAGYGAPSPPIDTTPALPAAAMPPMYQQAADSFAAPPSKFGPYSAGYALDPSMVQTATAAVTPAAAGATKPMQTAAVGAGGGLAARAKADEKRYVESFDALKESKRSEAQAIREKGERLQALGIEEAARNDELARISHDETRQAQEEHAKYLADTRAMIRDVAAEKVDPNQFFHSGNTGRDVTVAIGAMLLAGVGALASRDGRNPGVDALNAMIDRNIQQQERNIASKRAAIGERQDVYQQMRQELGDKQLADDKFRIAALESVKNRIQAFSAGSDSTIDAARTQGAIGLIQQEQDKTLMSFSERALQLSNQAAAATANRAREEAQRQFENVLKLRKLDIEGQDANTRALEAAGKAGNAGKDQREKDASAAETNAQFSAMASDPVLDKIGVATAFESKAGQRLAPGASTTVQRLETINTRILQAVGKVAKDADGKPNIAMIERLEARFSIHPDDTKEMAVAKIRGAQEVVNALARQQGASAPDPDAATNLGFKADPGLAGVK